MSVTAEDLAVGGGLPEGGPAAHESFLVPLVARLSSHYGLDPQAVRSLAVEVAASFADARVRAFIPVLVEKRLHDMCRGLIGP